MSIQKLNPSTTPNLDHENVLEVSAAEVYPASQPVKTRAVMCHAFWSRAMERAPARRTAERLRIVSFWSRAMERAPAGEIAERRFSLEVANFPGSTIKKLLYHEEPHDQVARYDWSGLR
jgi:hypothetical protein